MNWFCYSVFLFKYISDLTLATINSCTKLWPKKVNWQNGIINACSMFVEIKRWMWAKLSDWKIAVSTARYVAKNVCRHFSDIIYVKSGKIMNYSWKLILYNSVIALFVSVAVYIGINRTYYFQSAIQKNTRLHCTSADYIYLGTIA